MPRHHPDTRSVAPGTRLSLRRVRPDGSDGDLIGWVLDANPDRLRLRDRHGAVHEVAWSAVRAWRAVGVARGRDPLRTPRAHLDALADAAGVSGRVFVARLSDVLDGRRPPLLDDAGRPAPCSIVRDGEWATAGTCADYIALAWQAARADARSLQVRTDDPSAIQALLALGFTEL